ncbi:MAG: thioredoxin domain-containing protein, partial [Bdellovibrionales bacterium]|nr:thioredoxin domain-containing protein [Bdellovibrionales bacterium]
NHDPVSGGMSGAPKFPSSLSTRLLYRFYRRFDDSSALMIANKTLTKMAQGGIYDQVGGGFHRYATDPFWLVPHFEKMLYDNALLVLSYLDGYQATGDAQYRVIAEEVLDYILRDMTSPDGGFFSATDADSLDSQGHREEGWYFTWTPGELSQILTADELEIVILHYQVSDQGNFEGRSILHAKGALSETAQALGLEGEQARGLLQSARAKLYMARQTKPLPIRDEKILTSWNGLMISAFARAGLILDRTDYINAAQRAARFLLNNLSGEDGLRRTYKEGQTKHAGFLDDYSFFTAGLLDLFEATGEKSWLERALDLDSHQERKFEDPNGGFYMTDSSQEQLLAREMPRYDGAEPSGNSVAALNLMRLYQLTSKTSFLDRALRLLKAFAGNLDSRPMMLSEMLLALDFYLAKGRQVILVNTAADKSGSSHLMAQWRRVFCPNTVFIQLDESKIDELAPLIPATQGKIPLGGKSTAYVCTEGTCQKPTSDPEEFHRQLIGDSHWLSRV